MNRKSLLVREENKFKLFLNKGIYKKDIINKALSQEASWIKKMSSEGGYFCVELDSKSENEVLEWANYLIYLERSS